MTLREFTGKFRERSDEWMRGSRKIAPEEEENRIADEEAKEPTSGVGVSPVAPSRLVQSRGLDALVSRQTEKQGLVEKKWDPVVSILLRKIDRHTHVLRRSRTNIEEHRYKLSPIRVSINPKTRTWPTYPILPY